ncbi:MAG TPA: sugar-binding protein [Bacteroidales bacterium]|nr:sugar-binding protein [Bacteroidales bacterium]
MKNEKFPYFNVNGDDHQYRILWNLLTISGQNTNTEGLVIKESDPSSENYILEMKFPWKSLGYFNPKADSTFGFDVVILDNDGATREAMVAWFSDSYWSWNNTSYYGTVVLKDSNTDTDLNAVSVKTTFAPLIDGRIEDIWDNIPLYKFEKVITGTLEGENDLSGYYKTCWDEEYFYLLVNVKDNVKSIASVLFDYGWIEDQEGNVVWKMEMKRTKHAGGGLKNRYSDTIINLKKGQYYLRYKTDESNCPDNWDTEPSGNDFYGIKLLYE